MRPPLRAPENQKRQIRKTYFNGEGGCCAIGLWLEMFDPERPKSSGKALIEFGKAFPFAGRLPDAAVSRLNDGGLSFAEIADEIEGWGA